jgi:hypothetical protein
MNPITWIFYILRKVIVIPHGSANEAAKTEEDAMAWWHNLDKDSKIGQIKEKYLTQWYVRLALMVLSIWLIPYLRREYNKVYDPVENENMFKEQNI